MKVERNKLNNLFNQYDVEENAVTNAFLQTLAGNEGLLKDFLLKYFEIKVGRNHTVTISSQKRPSSSEDSGGNKEESEGRPDGWIIIKDDSKTDASKAIAFEVKIKRAKINKEQLRKHSKCLRIYDEKFICVITPDDENPIPELKIENVSIKWLPWRDIYNFIGNVKKKNSELSEFLTKQLKEYLYMVKDLVGFQGINYTPEEYNHQEAKIILRNLIKEIRRKIQEIYPALNYERDRISEKTHEYQVYHDNVWSYLARCETHTKDIHFTFWLDKTHMGIGLTVPNDAKDRWKRLNSICGDNFEEFKGKLFELRGKVPNLHLEFVHRHSIIRKKLIVDGIIEMDFDTLEGKEQEGVKQNKKWLSVIRELIENKKGNAQFMVLTRLFYEDYRNKMKNHKECKDFVVQTTEHFKDIYNYLTR